MEICLHIPASPEPLQIPFPGGVTLEGVSLEQILQPALAPLAPFFVVVDALAAVIEVVKAIPDAIAVPPNPTKFAEALAALLKKVARLAELLPVVSVPLMAVRLLDALLSALLGLRGKLSHLVGELDAVARMAARGQALSDSRLLALAVCLETNIAVEASNVGKNFASLGRLLGLLGLFLGLVGGPSVPDLSSVSGKPLREVLVPLDALVDALVALRKVLPL